QLIWRHSVRTLRSKHISKLTITSAPVNEKTSAAAYGYNRAPRPKLFEEVLLLFLTHLGNDFVAARFDLLLVKSDMLVGIYVKHHAGVCHRLYNRRTRDHTHMWGSLGEIFRDAFWIGEQRHHRIAFGVL